MGLHLKERGLRTVEITNADFLKHARKEALRRAKLGYNVSTDDLRVWALELNVRPKSRNAWGAVFRGKEWQLVGTKPSSFVSNHGRRILVWQLHESS
jgi:hypothetical protein